MATVADLEGLVMQHVYDEMVRSAEAAAMPDKFIDGIKMVQVGKMEWEIYNDWHEYDEKYNKLKPLAAWFEDGTGGPVSIWVSPRAAEALAWKSEGPEQGHGSAIYSKRAKQGRGGPTLPPATEGPALPHEGNEQPWLFSKGHYVTGVPKTESQKTGFERGMLALAHALGVEA